MSPSSTSRTRHRVFLVHGRDAANNDALRQFLRSIDLSIIEWEQAIRETGEPNPYVGDVIEAGIAQADAVVVLLTPDDVVRLRDDLVLDSDGDAEIHTSGQPRPNVIYEAGLARAMAPDATILVAVEGVKIHSDIAGRHLVVLRDTPESRHTLASRLGGIGLAVNTTGQDWLSAGRFVSAGGSTPVPSEGLPSHGHVEVDKKPEEPEESPGFLELLADMEEALPEFNEILTQLVADVGTLGDHAKQATTEMSDSDARGLGSKGKLLVAIRYAKNLEPLAVRSEGLVDQLSVRIHRVRGGLLWMLNRIESGQLSVEEEEIADDFLTSIVNAGAAARESIPSTERLIAAMKTTSSAARPVRNVTDRLVLAYRSLVEMMSEFEVWGTRADGLLLTRIAASGSIEEE